MMRFLGVGSWPLTSQFVFVGIIVLSMCLCLLWSCIPLPSIVFLPLSFVLSFYLFIYLSTSIYPSIHLPITIYQLMYIDDGWGVGSVELLVDQGICWASPRPGHGRPGTFDSSLLVLLSSKLPNLVNVDITMENHRFFLCG